MTKSSSAFRDAVFKEPNSQFGENGCMEFTDAGIGSNILALSQRVRDADVDSLCDIIFRGKDSNEIAQLVILTFVTRNTRGGKGEKKLAYDIFLKTWDYLPETAAKLLRLFPLYGYWKDLFLLLELCPQEHKQEMMKQVLSLVVEQWNKDLAALEAYKKSLDTSNNVASLEKKGPGISLLAKWLPRERKSIDKKIDFVNPFIKLVYPNAGSAAEGDWQSISKKKYRQQVAEFTSYHALPEVLLAAQRADEIEIQRVASKATKLLTRAFLNEDKHGGTRYQDPKRLRLREMFIDTMVKEGLKGGQVMPHEIVATIRKNRSMSSGMEMALDAQWKDMWKRVVDQVQAKSAEEGVDFDPTNMVPLVDVSGSMEGTPMNVAIALGIGISEITNEAFRDMVLTFTSNPEWHRLNPNDTIVQKVRSMERANWGFNTNFAKAYGAILEVCLKYKLSREEMPCLIVFSDMQFDQATAEPKTMFNHVRQKVSTVASKLGWKDAEPKPTVFWNLRNVSGHPVNKDTEGAVLLSGFSPSLLKLVMNGEALKEEEVEVVGVDGKVVTQKVRVTPEEVLMKMLNEPIYDPVRRVLDKSKEGALADYESLVPDDDGEEFEVV